MDFTKSLGSSTETVLEISIIPLATLRELYLKIDSMYITKSLKSKRTGFQWHPLEFVVYPTDKNSCAVQIIILYLGKTSTLKEKHNSSLFISYTDP